MRPSVVCLVACVACGRVGFHPLGADDDGGLGAGDSMGADVTITTNVMFVTAPSYALGTFGSLAAADAACQSEADQAGLSGTYVAWLSTSTTNAIDRLAGARGWVRPDGIPFLDLPTDILAQRVLSTPSLAADGSPQEFSPNRFVATGTLQDGTAAVDTCSDLTDPLATIEQGLLNTVGVSFTENLGNQNCNGSARIYCFGIDRNVSLVVPPIAARRAFMSTPWMSGTGLAGADAHCQADATAASVPGTYRALLATDSASASSRFSDGLPWVRLDGVPLAPTANVLLTSYLRVPLNVDAMLRYHGQGPALHVWLGAQDPSDVGTGGTCMDWVSAAFNRNGTSNQGDEAPNLGVSGQACDRMVPIYCLEI